MSVVVLCLTGWTPVVTAQVEAAESVEEATDDEGGRLHFQLATRHYERGEFLEAAEEFERAYYASGHTELLYNAYVAYRDADAPRGASQALRSFLETAADEELQESRSVLEERLRVLEERVAELDRAESEGRDGPHRDGEGERGEMITIQPHEASDEAPSRTFPTGPVVLMGVGGAAILGGVVTGVMALGVDGDLSDACMDSRCGPESQGDIDRGKTLALTTDVLLFGGAALAAGGLLWWLLAPKDGDGDTQVQAACTDSGCQMAYGGSF